MIKLDPKIYKGNPTTNLIAKVVHELWHMFDVLSNFILQNKKDIRDLQARIKELENKCTQ